jgi:hypothetical protein
MDQSKQFLLDDPALFILHYFPHRIQQLEDFHLRLIETAETKVRSLTLYPAGHGKTTLISTLLPIWAICKDPNIRVAVVAKNEDEAKNKIARVVQAELEGNEELIRDFGPFVPQDGNKSWSLTNMTIAGRTAKLKEPTLAFFGSGSKGVLGHRTDWTICDDVVTEKNSATPVQRESMKEWFDLSVETGPEFDYSRLTVVGTLFDPEDLYHDLIELVYPDSGEPIYDVQREDAIVDEEAHLTLWPSRWPWKRIQAQKAKMGTLNFNKRYRNIAVDKSRMVFKEAYVKGGYEGGEKYPGCLDSNYSYGKYENDWHRFGGFDPATGAYRGHKFCAHVTIASGSCADHEHCYWVVDVIRDQLTLPQQVETILGQHASYDLFVSKVEANSYQQGLLDAIKREMEQQEVAFRIEPHYTGAQNKPDPELGVQAMAPWFENGWVHIPWADPASRRKMEKLVEELVMYPGRTTDTVMALWFAWRAAQEGANKWRSFNRLKDRPGGPTPLGRRVRRNQLINPAYR